MTSTECIHSSRVGPDPVNLPRPWWKGLTRISARIDPSGDWKYVAGATHQRSGLCRGTRLEEIRNGLKLGAAELQTVELTRETLLTVRV
jgi:hypothetical protein